MDRGSGRAVILILLLAICPLAIGQTAENSAGRPDGLEEIVVTAQKREQSIQDVPISMTAFTGEQLEMAGVTRFEDLSLITPGLTLRNLQSVKFTTPNIRGVQADAIRAGAEPAVGVYVDEVYLGSSTVINSDLYDIERIEILRGPQGTLYGKNTLAGAIAIETRKPPETTELRATAMIGDYNARRARVSFGGPISDGILGQISALYNSRDGFTYNRLLGTRLNDVDNASARVALRFLPNDDTTIDLAVEYARDRAFGRANDVGDPEMTLRLEDMPYFVERGGFKDGDPFDRSVAHDFNSYEDRDVYGASLKGEFSLRPFDLVSITAVRSYEYDGIADTDASSFALIRDQEKEKQRQYSQELRLVSNDSSAFDWVAGLYAFHSKSEPNSVIYVDPQLIEFLEQDIFGLPLGGFGVPADVAGAFAELDTTSLALFGQSTFELTDRLFLTLGLRYTHDRKDFEFRQDGGLLGLFESVPQGSNDETWGLVSGSIDLAYQPSDELLAFAKIGRGVKSGGFNDGLNGEGALVPYDPESLWSYELGAKTQWMENRLLVNGSVWYQRWDDVQARFLVPGTTDFIVVNTEANEITGAELELAARPAPDLDIGLGYSYIDIRYPDNDPVFGPAVDRPQTIPEHTGSLFAQYSIEARAGTVVIRGEYAYQGSHYVNAQDKDDTFFNGSFGVINARVGFQAERWSAYLWGRNLSDETYLIGGADLTTALGPGLEVLPKQIWLGAPRTWGLELEVAFH